MFGPLLDPTNTAERWYSHNAAESFVGDSDRLGAVRGKPAAPMLERVIVAAAQHFCVCDPEANTLGSGEDFGERGRVDAGKDIFADQRPGCAWRRHAADAVDECLAVFSQQFADLGEIFAEWPIPTCAIMSTETTRRPYGRRKAIRPHVSNAKMRLPSFFMLMIGQRSLFAWPSETLLLRAPSSAPHHAARVRGQKLESGEQRRNEQHADEAR
jgi:hypothetical protein